MFSEQSTVRFRIIYPGLLLAISLLVRSEITGNVEMLGRQTVDENVGRHGCFSPCAYSGKVKVCHVCMPASYLYSVVKRVSKPPGFQFSLANVFMPRLCRWNKLQLQSKMLKVCSIYDYHQFSFYRPR